MDNLFIVAAVVSVIFLLLKFAEMRIIIKKNKPLKELVKDTFVVYFSIIIGIYILKQLSTNELSPATNVFVDSPNF
jgi:hypothetical protein